MLAGIYFATRKRRSIVITLLFFILSSTIPIRGLVYKLNYEENFNEKRIVLFRLFCNSKEQKQ